MEFLSILAGVAAIPKLIDRIDQLIDFQKKESAKKWMQISARVERKLSEAETPEQVKEVAREIHDLIRDS